MTDLIIPNMITISYLFSVYPEHKIIGEVLHNIKIKGKYYIGDSFVLCKYTPVSSLLIIKAIGEHRLRNIHFGFANSLERFAWRYQLHVLESIQTLHNRILCELFDTLTELFPTIDAYPLISEIFSYL